MGFLYLPSRLILRGWIGVEIISFSGVTFNLFIIIIHSKKVYIPSICHTLFHIWYSVASKTYMAPDQIKFATKY